MKAAALTHIGKVRATNEDSILVHDQSQPFYMLVADGMGGHAAGEVASGMVCAELERYISGFIFGQSNGENKWLHRNKSRQ